MNKATILIISENNDRIRTLVETSGKTFYMLTANTEESAIDQFLQSPVDAVLFGEEIDEPVKTRLTKLFSAQQGDTVFLDDHSTADIVELISNAIISKQKENKPAFSFKDDALKNAGLNIEIQ